MPCCVELTLLWAWHWPWTLKFKVDDVLSLEEWRGVEISMVFVSFCQCLLLGFVGELIWVLTHYTQVWSYTKVGLGRSVPQEAIMRDHFGLEGAVKSDGWVVHRELVMRSGVQVDWSVGFEILHKLLELKTVRLANYFLWLPLLLIRRLRSYQRFSLLERLRRLPVIVILIERSLTWTATIPKLIIGLGCTLTMSEISFNLQMNLRIASLFKIVWVCLQKLFLSVDLWVRRLLCYFLPTWRLASSR